MLKKSLLIISLLILSSLLFATVVMASPGWEEWVDYDFEGETLRFVPSAWDNLDWYDPDPRLQEHIEAVEEQFNCNIEFVWEEVGREQTNRLREAIMAGDKPVDFIRMTWGLARDNLLYPLDQVLEDDFYEAYPPSFRYELGNTPGMMLGDTTYGFETLNQNRQVVGILWNRSFFERHGLPDIQEMYEEGEWTYEALEKVAKEATMDLNGDGEIDVRGLGQLGWRRQYIDGYSEPIFDMVEGEVKFNINTPEIAEALEYFQRINEEEWLMTENVFGASEDNRVAMQIMWAHRIKDTQELSDEETGDEWSLIPFPKSPLTDKHRVPEWSSWYGAIPIYVEEPRAVIEVVRALWELGKPYIDDFEEWEEHYWYEEPGFAKFMYDEESLENYKWMFSKHRGNPIGARIAAGDSDFWGSLINIINDPSIDPSTELAEIEPEILSVYEEITESH